MQNSAALITGASGGIGLEMARILASKQIRLVLVARSKDKLKEIAAELVQRFSANVDVLDADLSKPEEVQRIFSECKKKNIFIDILINNAGSGLFGESISQEQEKVTDMLFLNIISLTLLCNLFAGPMKEQKRGMILNVGSLAGKVPVPFFASYAASKSYVAQFSFALRAELKHYGISVTCLAPGYVKTAFDVNAGIQNKAYQNFSETNTMHPQKVAAIGIRGMLKKKAYIVPGLKNRLVKTLVPLIPPVFLAGVLYSLMRKMTQKS